MLLVSFPSDQIYCKFSFGEVVLDILASGGFSFGQLLLAFGEFSFGPILFAFGVFSFGQLILTDTLCFGMQAGVAELWKLANTGRKTFLD